MSSSEIVNRVESVSKSLSFLTGITMDTIIVGSLIDFCCFVTEVGRGEGPVLSEGLGFPVDSPHPQWVRAALPGFHFQ
jgi:hypothetical protein